MRVGGFGVLEGFWRLAQELKVFNYGLELKVWDGARFRPHASCVCGLGSSVSVCLLPVATGAQSLAPAWPAASRRQKVGHSYPFRAIIEFH